MISRSFPCAVDIYMRKGWTLPRQISRIYDASRIERDLGFSFETRFGDILDALANGAPLPFSQDSSYQSPSLSAQENISRTPD